MKMPTSARTYNQAHIRRKYTPGKRRISIYWTWSYPWEAQRDPALDRLLPTANRQDDEAAAEFRRLTETGLRQRKAAALEAAAETMRQEDRLRLDEAQARITQILKG